MKKLAIRFSSFRRKLCKATQLSLADWSDLLLAGFDLAVARIVLMTVRPDQVNSHRRFAFARKGMVYMPEDRLNRVERVAKAVSLAARYVPWRSDCLVQALAARRRLTIVGLDSELRLGVRKTSDGGLVAHAWLLHGNLMVTGGNVDEYSRLL